MKITSMRRVIIIFTHLVVSNITLTYIYMWGYNQKKKKTCEVLKLLRSMKRLIKLRTCRLPCPYLPSEEITSKHHGGLLFPPYKMSLKFPDFIIRNGVFLCYRVKNGVTDFFKFCNPETSKIGRVTWCFRIT